MSRNISKNKHNIVVKSNDLIQKSRFNLSLTQQKILLYIISKISPNDRNFITMKFDILDFMKMCDITGKNYSYFKQEIKCIRDKSMWITTYDGKETLVSWISKAIIEPRQGTIELKLDDDLKPYLLELKKNFVQYELLYTLPLTSKYSLRFYEYVSSILYSDYYIQEISIEKLKCILGCENVKSYHNFAIFKSNVLDKAVNEINCKCDKNVSYSPIYQGKKVIGIKLKVEEKTTQEIETINNNIETDFKEQVSFWENNQ